MKSYIELLRQASAPAASESPVYKCAAVNAPGIPEGLKTMRLRGYQTAEPPREGAIAVIWLSGDMLNIFAVLEDSDPKSSASPKNDKTWAKGDAMEFFFQPAGRPEYFELHLAPTGATLELAFPSIEAFRAGIAWGDSFFESGMTVKAENFEAAGGLKGWTGHICVPLKSLHADGGRLNGARAAVCRYNYNTQWGEKPELSSTALFPVPGFHNPSAWNPLEI